MASAVRARGLETRTARIRLTVRPKPYHFTPIAPSIAIGYRRNMGPGVWVARIADGKGGNWTRTVGLADEFEDADGTNALTFWQATDKILKLVRGSDDAARRPTTIAEVIDQYEKGLAARGRSVSNACRIRKHLPPALAAKIVALLAKRDFSTWRADLLDGGMPSATFVRLAKAIKAALAVCDMRCGMAHRCQAPLARVDQRVTIPLTSLVVLPALPSLPKNPATWPQSSLHQA